MSATREAAARFDCFGSRCEVIVSGDANGAGAQEAVREARAKLLQWHARFSRFLRTSELSRLNADPRERVPVSPLMALLAQSVVSAGSMSGGLVDATMLGEIERAGYATDLGESLALSRALELAPRRSPARAASNPGWRRVEVDLGASTVTRPPGVKIDSGGLAKGLFADILAGRLSAHAAFAVNCAGDLCIGGAEGLTRAIRVESPFDASTIHTFHLTTASVATSGIGRRSWRGRDGSPAHHLLDPASASPAFTGIVQVSALAPSAMQAEIHAKAALLSGPREARRWLPHGGVIVLDDGSHEVIEPPLRLTPRQLSAFAHSSSRPRSETG